MRLGFNIGALALNVILGADDRDREPAFDTRPASPPPGRSWEMEDGVYLPASTGREWCQ